MTQSNSSATQSLAPTLPTNIAALNEGLACASRVEQAMIELFDLEQESEVTASAIAIREADAYATISAKTQNGKPLYTNDASRKAAAVQLCSQDAVLDTLREVLKVKTREIVIKKALLERSRLEVGVYKAFLSSLA